MYSPAWVQDVIAGVKETVAAGLGNGAVELARLQVEFGRVERTIDVAERRLVHVPEDSYPKFLDELRHLKDRRAEIKERIEEIQVEAPPTIDPAVLEQKIRARVEHFWARIKGTQVADARQELARSIDHISIAPDLHSTIVCKPGLLSSVPEMDSLERFFTSEPDAIKELAGNRVNCQYPRRDSNPRPPV